jgi:hypothetical protein
MQKDQEKLDRSLAELNNWVTTNLPKSKYVYINTQGDLWTGFDLTPKCTINWSSPKQLIPLFEELGFNLDTYDKKTKEKKKKNLQEKKEIVEKKIA